MGFSLLSVDICRGDSLPKVDDIDCVILGGTMHVVTEDRPWLHALYAWLRQYRNAKKPLLGICGGINLYRHSLRMVNSKVAPLVHLPEPMRLSSQRWGVNIHYSMAFQRSTFSLC